MLENLQSPLNQLYIFAALMVIVLLIKKLYAPTVILSGIYIIVFWMFTAAVYGIRSSVSWYYYMQLIIALAIGYALLVLFSWAADKWGPSYNSEGFIVILIPLIWSGVILLPLMLLKLIIQVVNNFT